MEAKNIYVIMARDIGVDAIDQTNTITKIIDKFTVGINPDELEKSGIKLGEQPIATPINYAIATSWTFSSPLKKDSFLSLKLDIIDPNGKRLGPIPQQENLVPAGIDRVNLNCYVNVLPMTISGKYMLLVDLLNKDGKKIGQGEYPFQTELAIQ